MHLPLVAASLWLSVPALMGSLVGGSFVAAAVPAAGPIAGPVAGPIACRAPAFCTYESPFASAMPPQVSGPQRPVGALDSLLAPRREVVASAIVTAPEFGAAVAIDPGNGERAPLAYLGAPRALVDGGSRGCVQVFRSPGGGAGHWLGGWGHCIQGRGLAVGARFGASLAASGGLFVVGAPGADGLGGERSGLVRIFTAPGAGPGAIHRPRLLAELHPPAGSGAVAFGETLAIEATADGHLLRLAVGAPKANVPGPNGVPLAGRVFVYRRDSLGAFFLDFVRAAPEPRLAATFGASLAFAGGHLLVGAPGDSAQGPGAGRVYGLGPAGAVAFELAPPDAGMANGARFGSALCAVGPRGFAVSSFGRGLVEVFRYGSAAAESRAPVHEQAIHGAAAHRFGTSLCTSGQLLLVGAPGAPGRGTPGNGSAFPAAGQVRVFARLGGRWSAVGDLRSPMPGANGEFGLALGSAGGYSLVGEPGSNGACADGTPCMAGLGAVFRMPR